MEAIRSQRLLLRVFWVSLLGLFLWTGIKYTIKVSDSNRSALLRWSAQIQDMESGENIHSKYNYPNPPIMVFILWPFAELATVSGTAAALVWFFLKVGMAYCCLRWAFALITPPATPFPVWAQMLAVALSLRPFLGDLTHGNINIFILFLVMSSLYAYANGRDVPAGLLLALAIACKVTPALFLVYFAWKRSWRVLGASAVGLGLFFIEIPAVIYGWQSDSLLVGFERNWAALTAWVDGMIMPYLAHGIVTSERENQSLPGVLTRLLTHEPSFSAWISGVYTPIAFHNVADWDATTIKRIVQVCQVCFIGFMVWVCRASVQPAKADVRSGWPLATEFAIVMVGMLLFSERTWKHHCVMLLLPFAVLCYGLTNHVSLPRSHKRILWGVLAVSSILILTTSSGVVKDVMPEVKKQYTAISVVAGAPLYQSLADSEATAQFDLIPASPGKMAQVYGAYVWAFLVLLIGLGLLARHARKSNA